MAIVFILLPACSSTNKPPTIKYYLLDLPPEFSTFASKQFNKNLVKVNRADLPDYLEQPNLVIREDNQQIRIANYHSWADNLGESIRRVLINNLNAKNNNYNFVKECKDCANLKISIEHFYPTNDGKVVLIGIYSIEKMTATKKGETFSERFMLSQDIQIDGYDHAVKKMSELLSQLSEQMTQNITITIRQQ
ncbi:MAG: ABC-type transport auxiliary lipoprotein family protein [Pseudomonadota bacterium]